MASWLRQLLTYGVALLVAVLLIGWILQHGDPNLSEVSAAGAEGGLFDMLQTPFGDDLGILSPRIFTMLVIMALVTTFTTGPLLTLFQRHGRAAAQPAKS